VTRDIIVFMKRIIVRYPILLVVFALAVLIFLSILNNLIGYIPDRSVQITKNYVFETLLILACLPFFVGLSMQLYLPSRKLIKWQSIDPGRLKSTFFSILFLLLLSIPGLVIFTKISSFLLASFAEGELPLYSVRLVVELYRFILLLGTVWVIYALVKSLWSAFNVGDYFAAVKTLRVPVIIVYTILFISLATLQMLALIR
jgi:hypothetical protein